MNILFKILLIGSVFTSVIVTDLNAQEDNLQFSHLTTEEGNIQFSHLTAEDGLSLSGVTQIFQDSKGFLWFGTYNGLNRYDGYNFKIFLPGIFES